MTTKRAATRAWEEALARRETLATEIAALTTQLEGLEAAEGRVLRAREGLEAVKRAREATSAGRAMLEAARGELADLDTEIPQLEAASDRGDLLYDMGVAAGAAQDAAEQVYSILRGILEREDEALEALSSAHNDLDSARATYDALGRSAVPGPRSEYDTRGKWETDVPERQALEAEIRRGGRSLKAVRGDLAPEKEDALYKLVWGIYWTVRARHRAELHRREQEELQRELAEAQRRRDPYIF